MHRRAVGEAYLDEHRVGFLGEHPVAGDRVPHVEPARAEGGQRCHHVVACGELVEEGHDLKRPRHPLSGNLVRREPGEVLAAEADAAAARLDPPGEYIEEGGLAGAVRAHDAVQLALRDLEVDRLEHHAVAEAHVHALGFDQRRHRLIQSCASPAMPSGLKSITAMKSRPK